MINQQLLDYVKNNIAQMKTALSEQGWSQSEINEAITETQNIKNTDISGSISSKDVVKKNSEFDINIELKNLSASQILLYIGGIIVVLAGITYVTLNWSLWGPLGRIIAIFLPTIICYIAGSSMFFKEASKKQGVVFLTVGSVLLPFFFAILLKELKIFTTPFDNSFNLIVSILSFIVYLISSAVYRFPIWSFLYQGAGLAVFYFFLGFIKINLSEATVAWLFLIPGTLYLLLSGIYERVGRKTEGYYSYALGIFTLVLSFARLFGEAFLKNNPHLSYVIVFLGIIYFILGILYEKNNLQKYAQGLYAVSIGIILFSFFILSTEGTILKDFTGNLDSYNRDFIGWSFIITGILYSIIGLLINRLKNNFSGLLVFKDFFDFICPIWILGAIFYLGLGGHKPGYETLLLITSLAYIFGSIPKISRQYLYIGTAFLVVYIFGIGGEYFQNSVGWPITLFVAGFISMGIGVSIEKVRQKYFPNR